MPIQKKKYNKKNRMTYTICLEDKGDEIQQSDKKKCHINHLIFIKLWHVNPFQVSTISSSTRSTTSTNSSIKGR